MAILTQQDWNLELAVNTIMHDEPVTEVDASPGRMSDIDISHSSSAPEHISPVVIDDDASASGPSSSHSFSSTRNASRMIHFNVEYRLRNIPIVLPDSETVGKIKEMIQAELGIPVDKQQLKGLVKRHVDDSVVLQDLHLPKDNVLYLLTPDLCSPTDNTSNVDNGQVSHRNDEYRLKVVYRNGSSYRIYNLNLKGSKTIKEVKQDVYSLTDVPVRYQEWKGWPLGASEDESLCSCGISFPTHELEVERKVSTTLEQHPVPNNEASMESESDEENMDIANDEDLFEVPSSRRIAPLISPNAQTEAEALEQFTHEFSERYGEIHPVFYIGSLDDAIRDALQVKATDRKLLALYLHHDGSIQANVFCSQLLCSESVVNVLSANFLTWAWDLTHPENMVRFLTLATKHFGSIAASQIRSYRTEQLPALLIISRSKATNEVIDAIQGHVTLVELMTRLLHAVDVFTEQKELDIAEERERMDRERIKAEQDLAYLESLETDRKKAEAARVEEERIRQEKAKEQELRKEEERKRLKEEAIKEAFQASVAKSVPEEPAEDAEGAVSRLRFRVPGGGVITRSFWSENTLQDVLNFLTAQGFHTEDYKVITTYPRRDITQLDSTQTLQSAKLFPQETLTLEEKS
ncbi:FAS-associated factor 1-like isoform X2 [Pomacea canaliculata]|nr:FAS-associated factor 1-like isoform X2 [Pomacea canaliculata]